MPVVFRPSPTGLPRAPPFNPAVLRTPAVAYQGAARIGGLSQADAAGKIARAGRFATTSLSGATASGKVVRAGKATSTSTSTSTTLSKAARAGRARSGSLTRITVGTIPSAALPMLGTIASTTRATARGSIKRAARVALASASPTSGNAAAARLGAASLGSLSLTALGSFVQTGSLGCAKAASVSVASARGAPIYHGLGVAASASSSALTATTHRPGQGAATSTSTASTLGVRQITLARLGVIASLSSAVLLPAPPGLPGPSAFRIGRLLPTRPWRAKARYPVGSTVTPLRIDQDGVPMPEYEFVAAIPGVSGATPPVWPGNAGVMVKDGTVIWLCLGLSLGDEQGGFRARPFIPPPPPIPPPALAPPRARIGSMTSATARGSRLRTVGGTVASLSYARAAGIKTGAGMAAILSASSVTQGSNFQHNATVSQIALTAASAAGARHRVGSATASSGSVATAHSSGSIKGAATASGVSKAVARGSVTHHGKVRITTLSGCLMMGSDFSPDFNTDFTGGGALYLASDAGVFITDDSGRQIPIS